MARSHIPFSFGIFINFLIIRGYTLFVCRTCHIRRTISCYVLNLASDRKYLRDLKGVNEHEFSTFFDSQIRCFLLKESDVSLILLILVIGVVILVITIPAIIFYEVIKSNERNSHYELTNTHIFLLVTFV